MRVFVRVSGVCAHLHAQAATRALQERGGKEPGGLVAAAGSIDRRGCAQAAHCPRVLYCVQISPRRADRARRLLFASMP